MDRDNTANREQTDPRPDREESLKQSFERGATDEAHALLVRLLRNRYGEVSANVNAFIYRISRERAEALIEELFEIGFTNKFIPSLSR